MTHMRFSRRKIATMAATSGALLASASSLSSGPVSAAAIQETTNLRHLVWGRPDGVRWDYQAYQQVDPDAAANLTVESIVGGQGDNEVAEQFRLMLSAGGDDVPDIIQLNRIQVPEFAAAGVLADLTDLMAPFRDNVIESAMELASFEDQVIAVPRTLNSKIWYYRADLFEQAGIDPDAVITFDDFMAAGRQLREALPDSSIYNMRLGLTGYRMQNVVSSHAPVTFFDREAGQYIVNSHPGFRALFETQAQLMDRDVIAPIDDFTPDWSPAFESGALASTLSNEWMTSFLPQYVPDQGGLWKVHAWPTIGESNQGSDSGGSVHVIPKQAKNIEAAFQYLSTIYLTEAGALARLETAGSTPIVKSARDIVSTMTEPASDASAENGLPWAPDFFGEDYFATIFDAQERVDWIRFNPRSNQEIELTGEWCQRFVAGQADVDGALEGLQGDLEGQIGDPWLI